MSKGLESLVLMTTGLINKEKWKECYNTIAKELKALEEIIKVKKVNVNQFIFIHEHHSFDDRNPLGFFNAYYTSDESEKLTQEEYDLLKEVLL